MSRINYSSGAKWENIVGYSRAVKLGNQIEISGSTAIDGDQVIGEGDPYVQAHFILSKIKKYLSDLGASMGDVIRTRTYVTDISRWEEVGKAHGEFFKTIRPATSMIQVSALIDPRMMVEIEVSAVIGHSVD